MAAIGLDFGWHAHQRFLVGLRHFRHRLSIVSGPESKWKVQGDSRHAQLENAESAELFHGASRTTPFMYQRMYDAIILSLLVLMVSCGRQDAQRGTVRGLITLDGEPLKQGSILFLPEHGNSGVATGGTVSNGHYELTGDAGPRKGWYRIEIRSVRKSGKQVQMPYAPPGEMMDVGEEAVDIQYNSASKLRVNVPSGESTHDFRVASRSKN